MPRAKASRASASFSGKTHRLSDAAARHLLDLLDLGDTLSPGAQAVPTVNAPQKGVITRNPDGKTKLRVIDFLAKTSTALATNRSEPVRFEVKADINEHGPVKRASLTKAGKILAKVESILGIYLGGSDHIDSPPRPVHFAGVFQQIETDSLNLGKYLTRLTDHYRSKITDAGGDLATAEGSLLDLAVTCSKFVTQFKGQSSMGRRSQTALCQAIKVLRTIFHSNYKGPQTKPWQRGPFKRRTDEENREIKFVETALRDARVIPIESRRMLERLFRDPRTQIARRRKK